MSNDFDQMAVVVDWLDACRMRNMDALLDLYSQNASLECTCDEANIHTGRAGLESYWRPRLATVSPTAFGMDEIVPAGDGVVLDYLSFEGKPVRIFFTFDGDGKILQSRCAPTVGISRR